ncbi:MAG TPA: hypothetical protein VK973_04780 [Arenicellales bacterium]|nr:hypothetical protein [Arenicellales bacterium]
MTQDGKDLAARLTDIYRGIEGYYILNRSGGLGYVSVDGSRLLREPLEGVEPQQRIAFFDALADSVRGGAPSEDRELGYLLPVDGSKVWRTATLVMHDHIALELKQAFDRDITQGRMSLEEGDRRAPDISTERGLHRGFEDLFNHIGSFGMRTWFPVLYIRPAGDPDSHYPMRVVNLMSLLKDPGRFPVVLDEMRRQLSERGALNQAARVEHRFTLLDEN